MEQRFIKKRGACQGWEGGNNTVVCVCVFIYICWPRAKCIKNENRKKNGTSSVLNSYHPLSRDKGVGQKTARVSNGLVIGQVVDLKKECWERPLAHVSLCKGMVPTADSHFLYVVGFHSPLVPVCGLDWGHQNAREVVLSNTHYSKAQWAFWLALVAWVSHSRRLTQ